MTNPESTDSTTLRIYKTTDQVLDAVAKKRRWTKKVAADEAAKMLAESEGVEVVEQRQKKSRN